MAGRREPRAADRGVVSVLSVFFVLLLLTFLAVSINLGRLMRTRGDLQHAADSAALAGVGNLDVKQTGGPPAGRTAADYDYSTPESTQGVAQSHALAFGVTSGVGQHPDLDPNTDVQYGFWHLRAADKCIFGPGNCPTGWEAAPPLANLIANGIDMFSVNAMQVSTHYALPTYLDGILGQGTTHMTVRSTAFGRRTRVPCALATAVSVCQIIDVIGGTGFTCPGGVLTKTFRNNETVHPDGLGRIDLVGKWDPGERIMRDFVRERDYAHCETDAGDMPPITEYRSGNGLMPGLTDSPQVPHANIQPVVDALAGVRTEDGTHHAGHCMLGQTFVVPVVRPDGINTPADCLNVCPPGPNTDPSAIPPPGCNPWPPMGQQRVVGFVNVTFTRLHCWHEAASPGRAWTQPVLTKDNCETETDTDPDHLGASLAADCSGLQSLTWGPVGSAETQFGLAIDAEITCDAPLGLPTSPTMTTFRPRLVR
jgi:hypothetical protein